MRDYLEDEEWQSAFAAVQQAKAALEQAESEFEAVAGRINLRRLAKADPDLAGLLGYTDGQTSVGGATSTSSTSV